MEFIPSKISTYFRIVGSPLQGGNTFKVSESVDAYVDALNCLKITQGNYPVRFRSDQSGSTSVGCFQSYSYSDDSSDTELVYPIISENIGKIYVYIRLRFQEYCRLKIKLDNVQIHTIDASISDPYTVIEDEEWLMVKFDFVSHVRKVYELSIIPESSGVQIDSILFSFNDYLYDEFSIGSDLYRPISPFFDVDIINNNFQVPYLTILTKLFVTNEIGSIEEELAYLDIKTTADSDFREGWSNFNIIPLPGYEFDLSYNEYVFGVFVTPQSDSYYLIWDYSDEDPFVDPYASSVFYKIINGEFINHDQDNQLSIKVFSDREPVDEELCSIQTESGKEYVSLIEKFSDGIDTSLSRNIRVIENEDGTESIELDLPDSIVSFIVDQSGSMTWNDNKNFRFDLIKDIADRFNAGYPGDVKYNLLTYQATPIITQFFAVLEDKVEDTSDIDEAEFSFFYDPATAFAGAHVVRKEGSPPLNPLDGEIIATGFFDRVFDGDLDPDKTYYYSVYGRDLNQHFSRAETIEVQPRPRIVPYGIKDLTGNEYIGTGARRDSDTLYIYHMDEAQGPTVYDFSFSGVNLKYYDDSSPGSDPLWIEQGESPQASPDIVEGKGSGIRLNGQSQYLKSNGLTQLNSSNGFSIIGWCYPHADQDNDFYNDQCLFSLQNDSILIFDDPYSLEPQYQSNVYLQIIQLITGEVALSFNGIDFVKSHGVLSPNSWNQIATTISNGSLRFYINGELDSEYGLPNGFVEIIDSSNLYIGHDVSGRYSKFFGKVTEFSVHSTSRNLSYINNNYLYLTQDNGDRILVLRFTYPYDEGESHDARVKIVRTDQVGALKFLSDDLAGPDNFGFGSGGERRIVYGSDLGPTHENDGEIIHDGIVSVDLNEITIIENYVSPLDDGQLSKGSQRGFEVYYRAFSQNAIGNWSVPSDSGMFVYAPKILNKNERPEAFLSPVSNVSITPGNQKMYIQWDSPQDENVSNVLVYFNGESDELSIDFFGNPVNCLCVFIGDKFTGEFVHRAGRYAVGADVEIDGDGDYGNLASPPGHDDIKNGSTQYYMIVTRDRFGNLSEPLFVSGVPIESADESRIPVESVLGVQKEPVDENSISLKWYNPIRIDTFGNIAISGGSVNGYLTDRVIFYARITDRFGRIFGEVSKVDFKHEECKDLTDSPLPGCVFMKDELFNPYTGEIVEKLDWDQLMRKSVQITKDGWVRVFMQPSGVPVSILSYISKATTNAWLEYYIEPYVHDKKRIGGNSFGFLYKSRSISLSLVNPFEFSVSPSTFIEHNCSPLDDYVGNYEYLKSNTGPDICEREFSFGCLGSYNGCYVNRNEPYRISCTASFEGKPLAEGMQAFITIHDDLPPYCDPSFWGCSRFSDWKGEDREERIYDPTFERTPSTVLAPLKPAFDFVDQGENESIAYLDVAVPEHAMQVRAVIYVNINGFIGVETVYMLFEPNLKISMAERAPISDGIDIAQQQAFAYIIDPDTGDQSPLQDLTVIKWELIKLRNSIKNRPFYTTSEVQGERYADGIYDYQINGVSDNVYFGPASDAEWKLIEDTVYMTDPISGEETAHTIIRQIPEEYIIRATVSHKGLIARVVKPVCIIPFGPPAPDDPIEPVTHFLIDHPNSVGTTSNPFVQTIWSDGIDFAEFDIVRDASLGETDAQSLFYDCHNGGVEGWFFTTLPEGKPINIKKGNFRFTSAGWPLWTYHIDIIHGDDFTLDIDEYGFEHISSQNSDINSAIILTESGNTKRFYVRSNGFVNFGLEETGFDFGCPSCFHCYSSGPHDIPVNYHLCIDGFTSIINNGQEMQSSAIGSWGKGIPPKLIQFKEPLKIEFSHIEINGELSDEFIIDGVSYNDLIFKVSFSDKRIPDGERCTVYSCGINPIPIESEHVYVENFSVYNGQYVDPLYWSYVKIRTYPIGPETPREAKIFVEINYDKLGTVARSKVYGISVNYEPPLDIPPDALDVDMTEPRPSNDTPFLRSCWVYDTTFGAYQSDQDLAWSQIPSMNMRRGMCEAEMINDRLYVFGGVTTYGITDHSESWSEGDDSWTIEESMPEPLFGYMSVSDGRYIYIIGGVGLDDFDKLQVKNTLYRFDTISKSWLKLDDMPSIETDTGEVTIDPDDDDDSSSGGSGSSGSSGGLSVPGGGNFGLRYGCAFGNSHMVDGKIHILCGVNLINSEIFEPMLYSNHIYIYDTDSERWHASKKISSEDKSFYNRINAFSFYDSGTGNIHVVSGQGYEMKGSGQIESSSSFTFTDSFRYNVSSIYNLDVYEYPLELDPYSVSVNGSVEIIDLFIPILFSDDNMYINMPVPRYRGRAVTIGLEHYFFGGHIDQTQDSPGTVASRKIELITRNQGTDLFDTDKTLPKGLSGRSFHGMASDNGNKIYIIGGLGTGHAPGYVQIEAGAYGDEVEVGVGNSPDTFGDQSDDPIVSSLRLDGESGATIRIRAFDDEGDLIKKPLTCVMIGYLIFTADQSFGVLIRLSGGAFSNSGERDRNTLLYPVVFSKNEFNLLDGIGSTRLMPRSEDPLRPITEIKDILKIYKRYQFGAGTFPYDTIMKIDQGEVRTPYKIEVRIKIVDDFYHGSTSLQGEDDLYGGEGSDGVFYFPEDDQVDLVASEGDWSSAELISGFEIRGSGNLDIPDISKTSSKIAMIAPKFDSDLFYFNTWDSGEYYFTMTRVGFSMIKTKLLIYNEDKQKVFEFEYIDATYLIGSLSHTAFLNGNSKYYLLVKALEEEGDIQLDADFGQYRIRVSKEFNIPETPPPIEETKICPFLCPLDVKYYDTVRCRAIPYATSYVDPGYVDPTGIDAYSDEDVYSDDDGSQDPYNIVLVEPLDFTLIDIDAGLFGGSSMSGGGIPDTPSPIVAFYADFEWLPEVRNILFDNESSYDDLIKHLSKLKNTIPFGSSPMLSSLLELSELLSINDDRKTIYMLTDNSENTSSISLEEAIAFINGVDGDGEVPIIVGNISNVYPITLSALASRTDTEGIDTLSRETRGRSFTVLSSEFLDDFVDIAVARGTGSVGFGEMYYVFDLKKLVMINSLSVDFFIPENTDANWSFATSVDGVNYADFSQEFNYNDVADFTDLTSRYIKWRVQFIHLLKPAEDGSVDKPRMDNFNIALSVDKESFIFMNKEMDTSSVQQLIATTLSSVPDNSSLEIGVGSGDTHDWRDFQSRSQGSVNREGKVFVPIRSVMSGEIDPEPLISIDDLVFEAFYGSWDINSNFTVVDQDLEQIDKSSYRTYPRDGLIVFDSYQRNKQFNIFIDLPPTFRVAVKVVNKKPDEQVSIDGIAYQYNTNTFLPSQYGNRPPVAYDLQVSPPYPAIYTPISASYRYVDLNGDPENKDKTEIRWYLNGVEVSWLKNLTRFNDLDNPEDAFYSNVATFNLESVVRVLSVPDEGIPVGDTPEQTAALRGESILSVGDELYFTVTPHDGFQYGDTAISNTVTVQETPPFITRLEVKGRRIDTFGFTDRFTSGVQMFADFDYFSPVEQNNSVIRWFVNDDLFKEGLLNESSDQNIINTTLNPGEISTATGVAVFAFNIGNVVYCEISPVGNAAQGEAVQSQTVTVQNEIPSLIEYKIDPSGSSGLNENIELTYTFVDTDLEFIADQRDRTIIRWFVSTNGGSSFVEFELPAGSDPKILYAANTASGQVWKVQLTPYDGVGQGEMVETDTVTIL